MEDVIAQFCDPDPNSDADAWGKYNYDSVMSILCYTYSGGYSRDFTMSN